MKLAVFSLEDWFRKYYFDAEIVLCGSGVEEYSLGETKEIIGLTHEEMDEIILTDSPPEGNFALRKAVADRWQNGKVENVIITHGSSEAMFILMNELLCPEDEVVVMTPCYQALYAIPEAIGCKIKPWKFLPENKFLPDMEELENLVTPNTRMVITNFPQNPTGTTLSIEQQNNLISICTRADAYLFWDSAFTELTYNTQPLPDPSLLYEKAITVGTLTKAYGLGGLRIGWGLAPENIIDNCVNLRSYTSISQSPLTEFIAEKVIVNLDVFLQKRQPLIIENLTTLTKWVEEHNGLIEWVRPQGGVTAFLKFSKVDNIEKFCRKFFRETGVFLLPGTCFDFPGYVRLGFGGSSEKLKEGLFRLSRFLK